MTGAGKLLAIVGGVARLSRPLGHAGQIRRIANEVGGGGERVAGERRHQRVRAGAETDNDEAPGHSGLLEPGTRTMPK